MHELETIIQSEVSQWKRQWQPTPVLLPGESHGQRSLVGCSLWGSKKSDMTEWLHFHFSLSCIGEGNGNPLQYSCLKNPRDGGAWWAAVYGVAQSWTRLKRLSSSSSSRSKSERERQILHINECVWNLERWYWWICYLFYNRHPNRCEVIHHCAFNLHSSDDWWCWALFNISIGNLYVFFRKKVYSGFCYILKFYYLFFFYGLPKQKKKFYIQKFLKTSQNNY